MGPNGNVWVTFVGAGIGEVTPDGTIIEIATPTPNSGPYDITAGPGNTIWFTQNSASKIAAMTLDVCPRTVWWDGGGDGVNWTDALNWSTDQLPGPCDDVYIRASPSVTIVHAAGSESIRSLHSDNAISFSGALAVAEGGFVQRAFDLSGVLDVQNAVMALAGGGTLAGTINAAASATVTFTSGLFQGNTGTNLQGAGTYIVGATAPNQTNPILLVAAANINATNFKLLPSGVISGPGTLTITSSGEWMGGTMMGSGITRVAGAATLTVSGAGAKLLSERTLENAGTLQWNSHGQSITMASGAQLNNLEEATFNISGDFSFLKGEGATPQISNDGTFFFGNGQVLCTFEVPLVNAGNLGTGLFAQVNMRSFTMDVGEFNTGAMITIASTFVWRSGIITDSLANFGQSHTIVILGTASFEGNFLKTMDNFNMVNEGSVVLSGRGLSLDGNSRFTNAWGARFEIRGAVELRGTPGQSLFVNEGDFVKTEDGTAAIRTQFNNLLDPILGPARVSVEDGSLAFRAGMPTMDGDFFVRDDAVLELTRSLYGPAITTSVSGDGTWIVADGGHLVLPVLPQNREWRFENFQFSDAGILDGPGTMSAHVFDWLANGRVQGAGITRIGQGDVMNIAEGVLPDVNIKVLDQRKVNNFGTITWSGSTDLTMQNGAMIVNNGSTGQGLFIVRNNQNLNNGNVGVVVPKLVMQNGGVFTKLAVGGFVGTTNIRIPVENNGGSVILLGLLDAPVKFVAQPVPYSQTAGSTRIEASVFGGTGKFEIKGGTFAALDGSTIEVAGSFTNEGASLMFDASTLDVSGDFDQTAGHTTFAQSVVEVLGTFLDSGGTVLMDESTLTVAEGIEVEAGAILAGSGVIHSDLLNAGELHIGGNGQAGTLVVDGAFFQMSSGILSIEIGGEFAGSQYDVLYVTGAADMAGTLNVSLIDGFMPELNATFQIISAAFVSGAFDAVNGLDLGGEASFVLIQQANGFVLVRNW
ncbi:MAG: hypothetical protein K2R98_01650 [Gemmataceae bacterium]|nr:hypothetical protein [Gemmataceae bacterium]